MDPWGYLVPDREDSGRIDLYANTIKVGRHPENDVVVQHPELDYTHFAILKVKIGVYLMALQNSGYETKVSGLQIPNRGIHILTDGSGFSVGNTASFICYKFRGYDKKKLNIDYTYYLGEILGSGAFGTVRYAINRSLGSKHAVKTIVRSSWPSMNYDREISIMKAIHHPNIIQVREVYEEGRKIHLVMELAINGNLMDYILATSVEYQAKQASWDICNGMKYLHSCGIVHRDLKPENVLVISVAPITVKIADFGLAKVFHEGTMLRSLCGTPNHMAPEVWLSPDVPEYGLEVDSWSIGVMTFIMLSCDFPFLYDDDEILEPEDFFRMRQIQWQCLPTETSWRARDFIQRLLVHAADGRLLLQEALKHVWFLDLVPRRTSVQTIASSSTQDVEEVAREILDGGVLQLQNL